MSKQISVIEDVRNNLQRMTPEFEKALPEHISVKKFIRVVQTAITTNPKLLEANRASLWSACMKSAESSLLSDNKESALVPYGANVQFLPMIAGLLKLARNSGEIKTISSQIVYENDKFEFFIDERGEHISHTPNLFEERGKIIAVYAIAVTKDDGTYIEVLTNEQVSAIESMSKGKNTPWKGLFRSEMIKKSALRRLLKRLPSSTDLEFNLKADNEFYDITPQPEKPASKTEKKKPSKLKELIAKNTGAKNTDAKPKEEDAL
ncbi:MAG: recombinase RecT [Gammaproteobacteria bacterium]|nr:recombinase RecT [Gammaproteobacteria bacterium]